MVMQGATAVEAATALISPAVKLCEFAGVTGGEVLQQRVLQRVTAVANRMTTPL